MIKNINPFAAPVETSASRLIGPSEFAALYGAAEFAAVHGLWLSTHITFAWDRLNLRDEKSVADAFLAFSKCYRDFARRRGVPPAWTYAHERGRYGLHTHLAMHFPEREPFRTEFKEWVQQWVCRRFGRRPAGALRVRAPKADSPFLHWRLFHYQIKGYDQSAIVASGRNRFDQADIWLADLIAHAWRDPGVITMLKRVGFSSSLGPGRRRAGRPFPEDYFRQGRKATKPISEYAVRLPAARPFRSRFEDGLYDVRALYGQEFCERVYGVLEEPPSVQADGESDYPPLMI